jgi:small-conductance mechanosensitive channel
MQLLRAEARRPCAGRREPDRTRAGFPLLLAPVTIALTAVGATVVGLTPLGVLLVTALVAVAGALVAHRTVTNVLAGGLLVLARPFTPGDRLRLYVPELARIEEAQLMHIGVVTTTLCTGSGVLVVPNAQLLRVPPADAGG